MRLNPEGKLNGHKVSVPRDADDIICAAFALGAMLFLATLLLNVVALKIVRKYREQYD